MTDRRISATCGVHDAECELVVNRIGSRLVLDVHADSCCVLTLDRDAAGELFEILLGEWPG